VTDVRTRPGDRWVKIHIHVPSVSMSHQQGSNPGAGRTHNRFDKTPFVPDNARPNSSMFALSQMIKPDDLSVVFQPIVMIDTLEVFAYEALVRCRAPDFSNPISLFDRAVETGCVGRLGRMIREVAVPLCPNHALFLNLHPAELQARWVVQPDDPMFFHDHSVYIEITESTPFTHFELCRDVVHELRSRGQFHLVVDDFGAGYSNLNRIIELEPRVIKLDRSLIAGLARGSRRQRLVRSIVHLCVDMDARVVAEGIETLEEWDAIRETGVHYGQGFLFARPNFPLPIVRDPRLKNSANWTPAAPLQRPTVSAGVAGDATLKSATMTPPARTASIMPLALSLNPPSKNR
jgi:EAL domain-containing protein (putative c-di-GMP-specific phosphodiesterase class I)